MPAVLSAAAARAFRDAIERDPSRALAWSIAGSVCADHNDAASAAACFQRALALAPAWHEAKQNLGRALFALGQTDDALALFAQAALGERPEIPLRAIAVVSPGAPSFRAGDVLAARRAWAQRFLPQRERPRAAARRSGEPLRVGYLSAFLHTDNWMKPMFGAINEHDRGRIAVHLISDCPASSVSRGYHPQPSDVFVDITGLSNATAAQRIAALELDILVDLNGYSATRRLGLVALRPAPLIVGAFSHYASTGIAAYDGLIADATVVPSEEEHHYGEAIYRVPGSYLAYSVDYPVPPVASRPNAPRALTYGCLAPQYKITDDVIAAWSAILRASPESRLILRNTALDAPATCTAVRDRFARHGIDAWRLHLYGRAEHAAFLRTYDEIDVALDTFPYNGGTTTMEALWQGVPVVTFWGDRWLSRTSASLLRAANLGHFVAADVAGYVALATRLAADAGERACLTELRATMRDRLRESPVCDSRGLARAMEDIYEHVRTSPHAL